MKKNETLQQFLNRISSKPQNKKPGGCDVCDAYTTLKVVKEGIYLQNIHHDAWCPTLQKINVGEN